MGCDARCDAGVDVQAIALAKRLGVWPRYHLTKHQHRRPVHMFIQRWSRNWGPTSRAGGAFEGQTEDDRVKVNHVMTLIVPIDRLAMLRLARAPVREEGCVQQDRPHNERSRYGVARLEGYVKIQAAVFYRRGAGEGDYEELGGEGCIAVRQLLAFRRSPCAPAVVRRGQDASGYFERIV
jgi:hypothetical protein